MVELLGNSNITATFTGKTQEWDVSPLNQRLEEILQVQTVQK